jgi:hypothetical protein
MRDKERGLVPSRQVGATDFVFNAYLNKLNPRDNEDMQKALAMSPDVRFREFLARVSAHRYKISA